MANRWRIVKCRCSSGIHGPLFQHRPCALWLVLDNGCEVSEWPSWRDAFRAVVQRQARDAFVHPARRNWQLPQTKRWVDG